MLGDDLWFWGFAWFWRSNAGIAWTAFSDIDFSGVSCIHNFMRRVTSSTYLLPAATLVSISKFFFQRPIFHMHCLSPFWIYFLPLNSSKTFLDFQFYWCYHLRKSYSSNHVPIRLIESCKISLDQKKFVGTVLMDLSKAFDSIPHDLLIAKIMVTVYQKTPLYSFIHA